jgi:hypothetical protein
MRLGNRSTHGYREVDIFAWDRRSIGAVLGRGSIRPAEEDCLQMPRFFFHVRDGASALDDREGEVLPGRVAAEVKAAQIARELAADAEAYRGYRVIATDEAGNEIASCPVASFTAGA